MSIEVHIDWKGNTRPIAQRLRLSAGTISTDASAFENPLIDEAAALVKA